MRNFYSNPAFEAKRIIIDEQIEARRKRERESYKRNKMVLERINSQKIRVHDCGSWDGLYTP